MLHQLNRPQQVVRSPRGYASHDWKRQRKELSLVGFLGEAARSSDTGGHKGPHPALHHPRPYRLRACCQKSTDEGMPSFCTPADYAFLNVHVTFPNCSVSPSLMGVGLSGSRRLPLMRVAFVLFRSISV